MLGELAALGMRMALRAEQQVEAAGELDHEQAALLELVSRTVRRTIALRQRVFADSKKTPEQRAAERAARAERAAEAGRPRLHGRTEQAPTATTFTAESGPSDREDLLGDTRERLLDPELPEALTRAELGAHMLPICKDLQITPKQETWSLGLMAAEISSTHGDMQQLDAERAAGQAAATEGVDWRDGVEFSRPPDVETKIGRFTFAPGGDLVHEDPPEPPESEWPPDIVGGRALPDVLQGRRPPDSG